MFSVVMIAVFALGLLWTGLTLRRRIVHSRHEHRIASYQFPAGIASKVAERYDHLDRRDLEQVMAGLRDYFYLCNTAGKRMVSMPSQVVDIAWHEFILFTRDYEQFCAKALGRFLHHTPAEAMSSPTKAQNGIKTAWRIACHRERIDPRRPTTLPSLFAIDAALAIPDGFHYRLDCKGANPGQAYCASHIGCGSGCGSSSGCSGDTSDGCGGGGCGGD